MEEETKLFLQKLLERMESIELRVEMLDSYVHKNIKNIDDIVVSSGDSEMATELFMLRDDTDQMIDFLEPHGFKLDSED